FSRDWSSDVCSSDLVVVGQHFLLPASHGPGEPIDLWNVDVVGPGVEGLESTPGLDHGGGGVDVSNQLLGRPGRGDLVVEVPLGRSEERRGGKGGSAS